MLPSTVGFILLAHKLKEKFWVSFSLGAHVRTPFRTRTHALPHTYARPSTHARTYCSQSGDGMKIGSQKICTQPWLWKEFVDFHRNCHFCLLFLVWRKKSESCFERKQTEKQATHYTSKHACKQASMQSSKQENQPVGRKGNKKTTKKQTNK